MTNVVKKLINLPQDVVDESLLGFVASNPSIVKKLKNYRVIVRADLDEFKASNKVALISGGGSGHEPMFAGFVGKGMLTACVAGPVFTSPPPSHILAALGAVDKPAGILVFVINYTGDRLNFGIVVEKYANFSNNAQKSIKTVTINDDCALTSKDRSAGRRGLAGTLFVLKICGAMAENGSSLDDIVKTGECIIKNMGTIGLSLSSCSLPGLGPTFQLGPEEIELGLGVHGEPGVKRMRLVVAKEAVRIMVDHMIDPKSATRLALTNGDEVAIIINNLGGMSQIEMNIVAKEVIEYLGSLKVTINRIYVGTFMTSLEMHGVSVSVLKIASPDWLACLDVGADCAAWPWKAGPNLNRSMPISTVDCEIEPNFLKNFAKKQEKPTNNAPNLNSHIGKCLLEICEILQANEQRLNELDGYCGDGDCGSTMKRGAAAIKTALIANELPVSNASDTLLQLADIWENGTGGTTGAIYSLFLNSASKSMTQNTASAISKSTLWFRALIDGTETIIRYGGAQPGDRTMVDPLHAAKEFVQKLFTSVDGDVNADFFNQVLKVVHDAAESTKSMAARAGRASYVAKQNLTHPDPGAVAVYLWMKAIVDYVLKQKLC